MSRAPARECSVCRRSLVFSATHDAWRCAFCQRHGKRKRDHEEPQNPNITFFEDVEVDST